MHIEGKIRRGDNRNVHVRKIFMNTIWSSFIQGANTLYYTRRLRFNDIFAGQYEALFGLDKSRDLKILEIGCGPGALAGALHRWYPRAEITAVDRDSEFIRFAREHESGIEFVEGDATTLPFADGQFNVTISNTVAEHIEPSLFYGEQLRVLKPGGICLVLSSRRGINAAAKCIAVSDDEKNFWDRIGKLDDSMERYEICRYPMSEAEIPAAMEKNGFIDVHTGFVLVDLTPDDPKYPAKLAHDMINANRYTELDAVESAAQMMPQHVTSQESEKMKRMINERYDTRIAQYERHEKQWDTNVSVIMVIRGVKKTKTASAYETV